MEEATITVSSNFLNKRRPQIMSLMLKRVVFPMKSGQKPLLNLKMPEKILKETRRSRRVTQPKMSEISF